MMARSVDRRSYHEYDRPDDPDVFGPRIVEAHEIMQRHCGNCKIQIDKKGNLFGKDLLPKHVPKYTPRGKLEKPDWRPRDPRVLRIHLPSETR